MAAIKVSVVVPIYNVAPYLRECLESLISQSLKDLEIICVDDGSTDACPKILSDFAARDPRVRVITKPNSGYGHTMNVGMAAAAGEYIGIVESDDYVTRDMFAELYKAAKADGLDVVKSDFCRFEMVRGQRLSTYIPLTSDRSWYDRVIDPRRKPGALRLTMHTWTGIYRREFLQENGIRHNETPGASYQDNGFFFQTMCLARRLRFLPRAFYMNRRDNPNSSVYDKGKVYAMCDEMAFIKKFLLERDGLWDLFRHEYHRRMLDSYEFTYNRIAEEMRGEFLERISGEFAREERDGQLDMAASFSESEAARVRALIDAPGSYPAYGEMRKLEDKIGALESELSALRNSDSYKIGRLITSFPRKLRDLIRR